MTTQEIFNQMTATGTATRETIDQFFALLAVDTLENQIAMALTPDDFGMIHTTRDNKTIEIIEAAE